MGRSLADVIVVEGSSFMVDDDVSELKLTVTLPPPSLPPSVCARARVCVRARVCARPAAQPLLVSIRPLLFFLDTPVNLPLRAFTLSQGGVELNVSLSLCLSSVRLLIVQLSALVRRCRLVSRFQSLE